MSEAEDPSALPEARLAARRGSVGELTVVFGLTVGLPLLLAIAAGRLQVSFDFGQRRLLTTLVAECVLVALLWPWLAARGWAFRPIAGAPEPRDILRGFGVALLAYIAYYISAVTWISFSSTSYDALVAAVPTGSAAPWVVILTSVLNPVVEEFLWLGYGLTALSRYGARTSACISISLRLAVHAYQGIVALVGVLPLAIVFTLYYSRTKRIWPVIVAHMLFDAIALLTVVGP